jgi:hypothetical protein
MAVVGALEGGDRDACASPIVPGPPAWTGGAGAAARRAAPWVAKPRASDHGSVSFRDSIACVRERSAEP